MARKDVNQLAKLITDVATGAVKDPNANKNPNVKVKGSAGGKAGGKARAENLTEEKRKEIAINAANIRWNKKP